MKTYVGIDPGLDGAVAIIHPDHGITLADAPTVKTARGRQYVVDLMAGHLRALPGDGACVGIEQVHAMPKQGVRSMFSMGKGFGIWLGIIGALSIPFEYVTPQAWKKAMLPGVGHDKEASRLRAIELFPLVADQLTRKKDHGRAEALLIAEYMRRKNGG